MKAFYLFISKIVKTSNVRDFALLCLLVLFAGNSTGQTVEVGAFDPGTNSYVSSGDISVPIKVTDCFNLDNKFELVISAPDGTFGAGKEKVIGTYASHFTTFINGTLPNVPGTNYKLKVRTTSPVSSVDVGSIAGGTPFKVIGAAPPTINIDSQDKTVGPELAFGFCDYRGGASIVLTNFSSAAKVTGKVYDKDLKDVHTIDFTTNTFTLPVDKGYSTAVFTATNANGTIATKSYLILNCPRNFAVNLLSANECSNEPFKLAFAIVGNQSVLENYPGYIYRVNWGDQSIDQYRICDFETDGIMSHVYAPNTSSCGQNFSVDGREFKNSYKVEILGISPFCEPTPTVKAAKVSKPPVVNFKIPTNGLCVGTALSFENLSQAGEDPDGGPNQSECNGTTSYGWYVDGSTTPSFYEINTDKKPKPFVYTFNTPGQHTIKVIGTTGACTSERTLEFCISRKPDPTFNMSVSNYCEGAQVTLASTTDLNGVCTPVFYQWEVLNNDDLETPASPSAYSFVGQSTTENAILVINKAGSYKVRLSVGNSVNCGFVKGTKVLTISSQTLTAAFKKPEKYTLCKPDVLSTAIDEKLALTLTGSANTPLYRWELFNQDGSSISNPSSVYEFIGGATTRYPQLNIKKSGNYKLKFTYSNECATQSASATKDIEVGTAPVVTAFFDPSEGFGTNVNDAKICDYDLSNPLVRQIKLIGGLPSGYTGTWRCVEAPAGINKNDITNQLSQANSPTITLPNLVVPGPGPATYKFGWGVTYALGCYEEAVVSITFYPSAKPGSISRDPGTLCPGASVTLKLSGYSGVIDHWEYREDGSASWTSVNNTTDLFTTVVNKNTDFIAVVTGGVGCGNSTTYPTPVFTVPVEPLPTAGTLKVRGNGPSTICEGDNLELELNGYTSGAKLFWKKREAGGNWSSEQEIFLNILALNNLTQNAEVQFHVSKNTCDALSNILSISVNKKPELKGVKTESYYCSNSTTDKIALLVEPQAGAMVKFLLTANDPSYSSNSQLNGIKTDAFIPSFTVSNADKTPREISITVTPIYDYGNGNSCSGAPVIVKYIILPEIKIDGGPVTQTVCSGEKIPAFSPATDAGTLPTGANITYQWKVVGSGTDLTEGIGTEIPLITTKNEATANVSTTITITPVYNYGGAVCFSGTSINYSITVKPGKAPNAGPDANLCNVTSYRLNANAAPQGFKGEWSVTPALSGFFDKTDPRAIVNDLVPGTTYKFTWTFTSNDGSCPPTTSDVNVRVLPPLTADFKFEDNKSSGCYPLSVKLINKSTVSAGIQYRWELNGQFLSDNKDVTISSAQLSPGVSFNDVVNKIKLIVSDGFNCSTSEKTADIVVYAKPKAVFVPDKFYGCAKLPVTFENNSKVSAYTPTDYTIQVLDASTVIYQKTTRDFSEIKTYEFDVNQTKTFTVKLKVANVCGEDETSFNITVYPRTVTAILEANSEAGCAPFTVKFSNDKSFNGKFFTWDFDDGTAIEHASTTEVDKPHTFVNPGSYHVKLTVTDDCSTDSRELLIIVNESPKAYFEFEKNGYCVGEKLGFIKTNQQGVVYSWDFFGNGTFVNTASPDFSYSSPGTYTVTLKAERFNLFTGFCTDIFSRQITIASPSTASFTTSANTINCKPFKLTVQSTSPDAKAVEWDFGDPTDPSNVTTGDVSEHTYSKAGTYTVKMTAYNSQGCATAVSQQVTVISGPNADFDLSSETVCGTSAAIGFTNKTTSNSSGPFRYTWRKNDIDVIGNTRDLAPQTFSYSGTTYPHSDKVSLTVTDLLTGCSETATKYVTYKPLPVADFQLVSAAAGCVPLDIKIINKSKNADGYQWLLDGAVIATGDNPQFPLLQIPNKTYKLKLRVLNNDCGNTESPEITISTYPKPIAAFSLQNDLGCNGSLLLKVLQNTSQGATSYKWEYDEGLASTGLIPPDRAFGTGDHWVQLTVSNGLCTDVLRKDFKVIDLQKPVIKPSLDAGCNSITVKFTSTAPDGLSYEWDFGVLGKSSLKEPVKVFSYQEGNKPYPVTLTVRYGTCEQQSEIKYIKVSGPPAADFDISPDSVIQAPNFTFNFINKSSSDATKFIWKFSDGKYSYEENPVHKFPAIGEYVVKLTVGNVSGCDSTIIKHVRVDSIPCYMQVPNAFEPGSLHPELQLFKPKALGLTSYSIKVFNRWGELLWHSTKLDETGSPLEGWDGNMNGSPAPQGVYVWEISGTFADGTEWKGMSYSGAKGRKIRNGSVTLIR